jgi:hypothetical protein
MFLPSRIKAASFNASAVTKGLLCVILFGGCAGQPLEQTAVATKASCERLLRIIADYPSQFASFRRGAPSSNPWQNANIWQAKPLYSGTDCQVWGWAKGRSNYSCQWRESDQEAARTAYEQYTPEIRSCLGDEWQVSEPQSKTGKETIFRNPSTNAVVSIRYFQDTGRPFSKPWYTSMVVGDQVITVEN